MKILYVTTISLTMNTFFKPHIDMLVQEGNQVDIACNYRDLALDPLYSQLGCKFHQVDFSRSPLSVDNLKAYGQLKHVIAEGNYDIVHCHTPNAAVITRLVGRKFRKKNGLKVFYTAHGFHFYQGAPKLNWMVYYPVEKLCSRFTDKLITINREDYELAKRKFKAKEVHYVPGVGVDLSKYEDVQTDRAAKRQEIGVPADAVLLLSVGELNENKNHQIIIRALAKLNDPNVHYAIAGVGDRRDYLLGLADELGVAQQVHLLGYRKDVPELNCAADVFCFPSFREGLPASLMEAMAGGLPCAVSRIRGNSDLIDADGGALFDPYDEDACYEALGWILRNDRKALGAYNRTKVQHFSQRSVMELMRAVYDFCCEGVRLCKSI